MLKNKYTLWLRKVRYYNAVGEAVSNLLENKKYCESLEEKYGVDEMRQAYENVFVPAFDNKVMRLQKYYFTKEEIDSEVLDI